MPPPSLLKGGGLSSPALLGLLVATAAAMLFAAKPSRGKPLPANVTPVPFLPSTPLLGNTLELAANAARLQDWVADRSRECDGQPFVVQLLGKRNLVYLSRPEHFEQVLKLQSSNFNKGLAIHDIYSDFMGESILLVNGDRWKYHRRVLVNLFSARALRDFMTPIIQKNILVLMDILARARERNEALDIHKLMNKFTFETFAKIGFGQKLGNLVSPEDHPFERAFDEAHHITGHRMTTPTWLWKLKRWLNVGSERKLRECVEVMDSLVMGIISDAIAKRQQRGQEEEAGEHDHEKDIVSIILE